MEDNFEIPIFLIDGFLDCGKTSFISDTIAQGQFDEAKNKMVSFYVGGIDKAELIAELKTKVPDFMVPNLFMQIDEMPLTKNGKIDRNTLKEIYRGGRK